MEEEGMKDQDFIDIAQGDLPTNQGNATGLYRAQKTFSTAAGSYGANYREYNPKDF